MSIDTAEKKMLRGKKLLYILNVAERVNNFSYSSMIAAQELGIEFHIAGNWSYASQEERLADEEKYGIKIHQVDFIRTPYHPGNRKAYSQLKHIIQREEYDVIHCNTPIGGVLGRILGKKCKIEKVIYQAHGFHFYKGAPLLNWLIYYPVEKVCSYFTDVLITINKEDYILAKQKMRAKCIEYVPGVGIDLARFQNVQVDTNAMRNEIGVPKDATLLLSVGELNENKNHEVIIRAVAHLNNPTVHYAIVGKGDREIYLSELAQKLGVAEQVHLLGYRTDVTDLYKITDIYVLPSIREGLSRSIMEAMASGLPCAVSNIRGNIDLIDKNGGVLFDPYSVEDFKTALNSLLKSDLVKMGEYNAEKIQAFSVETVNKVMFGIYEKTV